MSGVPFCDVGVSMESLQPAIMSAMESVIRKRHFILGEACTCFERNFADYCGTSYAIGVGNGLDALYLALRSLNIGAGDEVIVPSNTYIATWMAVSRTGATPVPVEPDILTYNINPLLIEEKITSKTKAIIPVHLYGQCADMTKINAIAQAHKLFIVEDFAQAQGAKWVDQMAGSMGHVNGTSFYPSKNLGALGDGGMVTTNDSITAEKIRKLRNYGSAIKYVHDTEGINSRLDELQAAILDVKLPHLELWNHSRQAAAALYTEQLQGIGDLMLPYTHPDSTHVYHLYIIRTKKREALQKFLHKHSIYTLIHYPIPPHLQKVYAHLDIRKGACPVAEELAETCLSLPMFPGISVGQISEVCTRIHEFFTD